MLRFRVPIRGLELNGELFCDYALFAARHGTITSTTRFRAWGPDVSGITRDGHM